MTAIPKFDDLPRLEGLGIRHAWDVWGPGDRLGTLNRLDDATVLRALALPRLGRRVNLSLPLDAPQPPLYGRAPLAHRVFARNRNMIEDEIERLDLQASSQWDALRHIQAREHGFYGGRAQWDSPEVAGVGIHNMAELGFVARGVLVDLPRVWDRGVDPLSAYEVTAAELDATLDEQGVALEPGDLLLVRTGWLGAYRTRGLTEEQRAMPPSAGLRADEAMARWLWDTGVCAVATDNPAVEVLPADPAVGSLHRRLIPALGMPLGELWQLDELAGVLSELGSYVCCVVSVPLNLTGGVASPANALGIV